MFSSLVALLLLVLFIGLYLISRKKGVNYDHYILQYGFKFPILAPIGFYLAEKIKIPYRFGRNYDRKMKGHLIELFGQREASIYFEVHKAQKFGLTTTLILFLTIIFLLGKAEASSSIFIIMMSVLIYIWLDKEIEKKLKLKKRAILIDLPEFINTLAILINAGLPFTAAVQKVVSDSDVERPLYKELRFLLMEISAGKPINQTYEDFAQRCKVPEITRFVSSVLQNINKGSSDLVYVLRILSQEAWEKRKDIAKKQGEEASSKLVFPMVMVFIAVAIIVLAPAMISMGGN